MVPEINYADKSDRDILIEVVTTINGVAAKVDAVCVEQTAQKQQLTILQTEHDGRKAAGQACDAISPVIPRKLLVMAGGVSGGVTLVLIIILMIILKSMGFSF